jgi:hypothetical protein
MRYYQRLKNSAGAALQPEIEKFCHHLTSSSGEPQMHFANLRCPGCAL